MTDTAGHYLYVTDDELERLRNERVRALELDHARTVLLCREVVDTEAVNTEAGQAPFRQLAELDRRIALHTGGADEPKHAVDDVPDAEPLFPAHADKFDPEHNPLAYAASHGTGAVDRRSAE